MTRQRRVGRPKGYVIYRCECGEAIRKPGLCGWCVEERTGSRLSQPVVASDSERTPQEARLEAGFARAGELRKGKKGQAIA